ncbi:MAG: hypothetical protein ACOCRO_03925 [Halanaerobiales bacterium]
MNKPISILQKSIYEIRNMLLGNEDIRKIVVNDVYDPLAAEAVSYDKAKENIHVAAVLDTTNEEYNKNTFVTITLERAARSDESKMFRGILSINALSHSTY